MFVLVLRIIFNLPAFGGSVTPSKAADYHSIMTTRRQVAFSVYSPVQRMPRRGIS